MQETIQETDQQAWDRIGSRASYRCGYCGKLITSMRNAAETGGATAAMDVLRNYKGMICACIDWMLWPGIEGDDPGGQAVS